MTRSDVSVKNDIRNQLRLIAFPETTNLQAPVEDAKSKGAKKKKRVRGTTRAKSRFEHVDKRVADSQSSQSKPSSSQKKPSSSQAKPPVSTKVVVGSLFPMPISYAPQNPLFEHMPKFMRPYIEDVKDVSGDGYCGYRAISLFINGCEEDFELVRLHMKRELNLHREMYLNLFGGQERLKYIEDALVSPKRKSSRHGVALKEKWFTFPDMGFVVASMCEKVVVQLSKIDRCGASKTCFPLRGKIPTTLTSKIICIGAIPDHFLLVTLKEGCPIPPTAPGWKEVCTPEAAAWESLFVDRQQRFKELLEVDRSENLLVKPRGVGSSSEEPIEC